MKNDYLLLIDGSSLLSTQFFGSIPRNLLHLKTVEEKEEEYTKLLKTSDGIYTNGVFGFVKYILKILREQKPSHIAVAWDLTRDTFRRRIYKEYKANRDRAAYQLSEQYTTCKEVLREFNIQQFMSVEYEADDLCGSLAKKFEDSLPVYILTKDRDYLQLVNDKTKLWFMSQYAKDNDKLYKKYSLQKSDIIISDRCFLFDSELIKKEFGVEPAHINSLKGLAGDKSDNIKGVKGIGEDTAKKLISEYGTVSNLYSLIEGRSDEELSEIKEFWKKELGISRNPLPYLMKTSDTELVGEEAARISEELATIKTDIEIDIGLDDLKNTGFKRTASHLLKVLEFNSINIDDLISEEDFETKSNPYGFEVAIENNYLSKEALIQLSRLRNKEDVSNTQKSEIILKRTECRNVDEFIKEIHRLPKDTEYIGFSIDESLISISTDEEEIFCYKTQITGELINDLLLDYIRDYKNTSFVTLDLKDKLRYLNGFYSENIYDLSVAHYLLNPIERGHGIEEILIYLRLNLREELKTISVVSSLAARVLLDKLRETGMYKLYKEIEQPLIYTLFEMEERGIKITNDRLETYSKELSDSIDSLENRIYEAVGEKFNIASPKQLGEVLFEKLKLPFAKKSKSGYSTAVNVLERLREEHIVIDMILEYRKLTKLRSTYTDSLYKYVEKDGRIHSRLNQMSTATGRLSSTEPNLQNIPIRMEIGKRIRKAFVPKEGYIFIDADYSQIELRIMAHLSNDEELIKAYNTGEDIHRITASKVFKKPMEKVTENERRSAKAVNFGIIYGISSFGLSENLGISPKESKKYIDDYFLAYPKVKDYLEELVKEGSENGFVRTIFGRIRPIEELESSNKIKRKLGERIAMNSPIQGSAADIIKIAMNRINDRLKKEVKNSSLILQIHDELLVEAKIEEKEVVEKIVREEMEGAANLRVPLIASIKSGYDWYDVH